MFLRSHIKETFRQPGTLRVRIVFGEFHSYSRKEHSKPNSTYRKNPPLFSFREFLQKSKFVVAFRNSAPRIDIQVYLDSFTVRALYEGLLVTLWTTAQKRPQQRWSCLAQLAFILVFFATLTIVGRCYASTSDASAPLDQFHPRLQNNSIHPTSNLVLGRLFFPNDFVKSDTRFIRKKNHHPIALFGRSLRTKRELEIAVRNNGTAALEENKLFPTAEKNLRKNDGFKQLSVVGNISESIGAGNSSRKVTFNDTVDEDIHQNDGHFQEIPHSSDEFLRTTQRPMPPAHAHDNESGSLFFII